MDDCYFFDWILSLDLHDSIAQCFAGDDVTFTKKALEKIASEQNHPDSLWAKDTLEKMLAIPEDRLKVSNNESFPNQLMTNPYFISNYMN